MRLVLCPHLEDVQRPHVQDLLQKLEDVPPGRGGLAVGAAAELRDKPAAPSHCNLCRQY